jgi:serine protease inhibitor ecotin
MTAFTAKQRQAPLVMATGAGMTRTVIALVKQLLEAWWVKTVLFHHAFTLDCDQEFGIQPGQVLLN